MKTLRTTLMIACGMVTQCQVTPIFAQDVAALVAISGTQQAADEKVFDANAYFEYTFQSRNDRLELAAAACKRGGSERIREIARGVIKTENSIGQQEKALAEKRNIRRDHHSATGRSGCHINTINDAQFDATFVACTISLLEKDIEIFRRAAECEDRWVRLVACERLTIAEDQLSQLRAIRDKAVASN